MAGAHSLGLGWGLILVLAGCGQPERTNPADPLGSGNASGGPSIQLIATLPEEEQGDLAERLVEIRYEISAADIKTPLRGRMDLVGRSARALVQGVPRGQGRVFRVEAVDGDNIPTFAAADTLDTGAQTPQSVVLSLGRLRGSLELNSELPPEVVELEVSIDAGGDTLLYRYAVAGPLAQRIDGIPTGSDVAVTLRGFDGEDQVLVQRQVQADIRADLLARITLEVVGGSLHIVARFPEYLEIAQIDRFSDDAGTFFRRTDDPDLPGPNQPIDFDQARFRHQAYGPNGEGVTFYHFDARPRVPGTVYVAVDRRGEEIKDQLPVFDRLPGEAGYSDFWHIHQVRVLDREFRANALRSVQAVLEAGWEVVPSNAAMHAVLVPAGSKAALRFDGATPVTALDGWHEGRIVKYLLFEHPQSVAGIDFGSGQVNTPQMYAFFDNDRDEKDGFAREPSTEQTHNVATRLPGDEGYSPLWVLQVFKLAAFDRVQDLASALDQSKSDENKLTLPGLLHVNAPIVRVQSGQGG